MNVSNQRPVELKPYHNPPIKGNYDITPLIEEHLAKPLFNPINPSHPVIIQDDGVDLDETDVTQGFLSCNQPNINMPAEETMKELLRQTLAYYSDNPNFTIQDMFVMQAATKENMPLPTSNVIYTPATDVIPASRDFLTGACDFEQWFASLAFYARPRTLGIYFATEFEFDAFKTWLQGELSQVSIVLPPSTNQLFQEFLNLELKGLTESIILRKDDTHENHEYSFARTLMYYINRYTQVVPSSQFGLAPFQLNELYLPKTLVMINVERHAKAPAKSISNEWNLINRALSMNIKIVNMKKLQKLTTTFKMAQNAASNAQQIATDATNRQNQITQIANLRFKSKPPSNAEFARIVKVVLDKMAFINRSDNTFKMSKASFARANRRDPDDFNKQGIVTSTKYRPDIHLYIDTSGSISEENYQDAVKASILMAKKLNVNLYFNSFSHVLSQEKKLNTKDRTTRQIYKEFQRVPKVTGGTDFAQIWHYINNNKRRQRELSIIMTDFEWAPNSSYIKHPKNLYYIPCSNMHWKQITDSARSFCKSMLHIDPKCRAKLLF